MSDDLADALNRRYRAALVLVAVLVLANQLLVQPSLVRLTTDAPVINIAGRQRMLSQRLAKAALALERSDGDARSKHHDELLQVLALWSKTHAGLRNGNPAMSLPGGNSAAVSAALDGLEPFFVRMRSAAARLVHAEASRTPHSESAAQNDLATILGAEAEYLERMDNVVSLLEHETRERVRWLFWTGWIVAGLILVVLVAIGLHVVQPALELVRRKVDELAGAKKELEDRVRERSSELQTATDRHQAIVEQFSHVARTTTIGEMATGLAHELNQPLGAIANYAEGCLVELETPRPAIAEIKSALEKILASTLRAGQIIDRIRKFVTRHERRRELFEPNRVVREVEEILRDEAAERGIKVGLELAPDLPNLRGDAVQVQQVLVNLLRNALESMDAAKPLMPTLFMQTKQADCGGVEFCVSDNGEGIDKERLGKVFDAYFSTRAGGMGMGLAISRTIVEAHQGRITVTSHPGIATIFRFTIPGGDGNDEGSDGLHR
jgi:signal transduction histidine kinase